MRRVRATVVCAVLAWTLVPGINELAENLGHLAREGHLAHAAPDGDRHEPIGPEHGCTGTVHLCSCCPSVSYLLTSACSHIPDPGTERLSAGLSSIRIARPPSGIDHPPRA
jgi:hypothetical protein